MGEREHLPPAESASDLEPRWLQNYPELRTRRDLLAFLLDDTNSSFRKTFFRKLNRLINATDIRDSSTALHCINLLHRDARTHLLKIWYPRFQAGDYQSHMIWNQAMGVLRNLFKNMMYEVDPTKGRLTNPCDLRRGEWLADWRE